MSKGYIQVYTGNGKGKTTAALGLAIRAIGAGKKAFIGQFVKGMHYSELDAIKTHLNNIEIKQYGLDCFIVNKPEEKDIIAAKKGLDEMKNIILSGKFDVIIMDELNIALYYKLFDVKEVLDILKRKPAHVEIVITGRYAPEPIIDIADLVTEMKEIKHYYQQGVQARKGIEL
ncbi:MAG: cob(I)yrinic acid a,c-diamide adenosyltransferase [Bacteroidetes bacterium]|nr:cob(I)yrinic acid a,c-diamide adenosyltransferase [Bacteroidota bacterium]